MFDDVVHDEQKYAHKRALLRDGQLVEPSLDCIVRHKVERIFPYWSVLKCLRRSFHIRVCQSKVTTDLKRC